MYPITKITNKFFMPLAIMIDLILGSKYVMSQIRDMLSIIVFKGISRIVLVNTELPKMVPTKHRI